MRKLLLFLLFPLLAMLSHGCAWQYPCTDRDMFHPDTYAFRESIKGLDNKYRFQEFWVDGVDSSALLDSIGMRGEMFRTYDFDKYDTGPSNGNCPSINAIYWKGLNYKVKSRSDVLKTNYSLFFHTLNGLKGKLFGSLAGSNYITQDGRLVYLKQFILISVDSLDFAFNRNIVTITSNRSGHERKLVIY